MMFEVVGGLDWYITYGGIYTYSWGCTNLADHTAYRSAL